MSLPLPSLRLGCGLGMMTLDDGKDSFLQLTYILLADSAKEAVRLAGNAGSRRSSKTLTSRRVIFATCLIRVRYRCY
jgi:hypothetical protein